MVRVKHTKGYQSTNERVKVTSVSMEMNGQRVVITTLEHTKNGKVVRTVNRKRFLTAKEEVAFVRCLEDQKEGYVDRVSDIVLGVEG